MKATRQLAIFVAVTLALPLIGAGAPAEQPVSSTSFVLPNDPVTFKPGAGSDIASGLCLICHSAEYVYMQPLHDQAKWKEIVLKMKSTFGCPIPENQIEPLVNYLVSQNAESQGRLVAQAQGAEERLVAGATLAKGQPVYETYCVNCHGSGGKGDGPVGKTLVPPAANLTSDRMRLKSDGDLLKVVKNGRPGTAMPGWKGDLSDTEIVAVLGYIRSLSQ